MNINYLSIENFASHALSYIDFSKFSSALVVGIINNNDKSSNGAGKSSMVGAIRWCLFEKSVHRTVEDIIRHNTKNVKVEMEFVEGGQTYKVIRQRNRSGLHDVALYQNGKNISGSTPKDTNNRIVEILNFDDDIFVNSVFLQQNDINRFSSATSSERKELIKSMLNITKWDVYESEAKERARKATRGLEEYNSKYNLDETINTIRISSKNILNKKTQKEKIRIALNKMRENLSEENMADTKHKINKKKELEIYLSEIENKIRDKNRSINLLKSKMETLTTDKSAKDKVLKPIKPTITKEKIEEMDLDLKATSIKKGILEEELRNKRAMNVGENCYVCDREISEDKAREIRGRIVIIENTIKEIVPNIENLTEKIASARQLHKDFEIQSIRFSQAQKDIERDNKEISEVVSDINTQSSELENLLFNKNNIKAEIDTIKINNNVYEEKNLIHEFEEKLDKINIEIGLLLGNRDSAINIYRSYKKDSEEINKVKEDANLYEELRKIFGKKGIQSIVLSNVIEDLEFRANNILKLMCEDDRRISVSIDTQRKRSDGTSVEVFDINAIIGSRVSNFESLSGGEKVRVALAIRLALSQILSTKKGGNVGIILLDEVDGSLDQIGVIAFTNIIKNLEKSFKVLVITHKEDIKDSFLNKILVKNDFGISKAYQCLT